MISEKYRQMKRENMQWEIRIIERNQSPGRWLLTVLLLVMFSSIAEIVIEVFLEKQPYDKVLSAAYLKRLAFRFIFWALLSYYWVYGEKKTLLKKKRELEALNSYSAKES